MRPWQTGHSRWVWRKRWLICIDIKMNRVSLIKAENHVGVTFLDKSGEIGDLLVTPQHGDEGEAKGLGIGRPLGAPGVHADKTTLVMHDIADKMTY